MAIGSLIAAGIAGAVGQTAGSLGSSAISAQANYLENQKDRQFTSEQNALQRQFSALEAQKQRDYEREMSNSAYQRAIADMEAAGLNPASLSGTSSPASTPSGASANAHTVSNGAHRGYNFNLGDLGSSMFSSAVQHMLAKDRDAARHVSQAMVDNAREYSIAEERAEKIKAYQAKAELDHVKKSFYENKLYNEILNEKI